jgi:hypothetical protein
MSEAKSITFIGGPGGLETLNWGGLEFPLNTPVLVDPDTAATEEERRFFEYMIIKAKTHPALTIEDAPPPPEAGRKSKATKAKQAEPGQPADDDYPEEPTNGDLDADYYELPKDFREMHHKKLIALARKLGGEGDALATRDGAIAYIEERVALEGNRLHLEHHDDA